MMAIDLVLGVKGCLGVSRVDTSQAALENVQCNEEASRVVNLFERRL